MKKYIALLGVLFVAIVGGIVAGGVMIKNDSTGTFTNGGYILGEGNGDEKSISFLEDTSFNISQTGTVEVKDESGDTVAISASSFVHLTDESIMALAEGVLLDFSDLSSNFINNYYISATLPITATGTTYTASTTSGDIEFGEHLWKLSDSKYLIRANSLSVYFSDDDIREVSGFIEISVTSDGIVQILTEENVWMTISESCYIETEGGVTINPVTQIIDDGTYKISIPELSVNANDNIVLTEYEKIDLIVPEFNVETTDGVDGADGEAGVSGDDGIIGVAGDDGTAGESGAEGADGESGDSGSSGVNGSNGVKGLDATIESSTNTALPTMTISYWNVTEDSLEASIEVSGGVEALELSDSKYDGSITITNVSTGEVIYCYETDELFNIYDNTYTGINFRTAVGVSFATLENALEADTEYKLSVNAYYTLNDVIYSREFIGRTFYTDSTGLQISEAGTTSESLTVDVSALTTLDSVTLYLLTAAQNETFSTASISDQSNYVALKNCSPVEADATQTVTFDGLSSNTEYVVRAIVNGIISDQEEVIWTLKKTPTWSDETYPVSVYYNRVDGTYEVYRPSVLDEDMGAVKYVYTAYTSDGTVVTSKTLAVGDSEPVVFSLTTGETYYFGVELYFDDNDKTITYYLGRSENVIAEGTTLPTVKWMSDYTVYYEQVDGTIEINTTGESLLKVENGYPLTLNFYADQVLDTTIEIESDVTNGYYKENEYDITYSGGTNTNTNYATINLNYEYLLKNTNYTITISGYVDLLDGNGYVNRTLGTVSFRTTDTSTIYAAFTLADSSSNAISQNVVLTIDDDGDGDYVEEAYIYENLLDGQVTMQLYSGTGTTKTWIGTTILTGEDTLEDLYTSVDSTNGFSTTSTGVTITEDDFNLPNLDTSANYTLVISEVVDGSTYISDLGYQNEFTDITPSSTVITATPTPPDLTSDPTSGVEATPIYNKDAATYGAKVDEKLPDETIIGYRLTSTYDNSQRLGTEVTYYAFEYSEYYYALNQSVDPITGDTVKLREITVPISSASDTVPEVAFFFTGVEFNNSSFVEGTYQMDGCYIYQGADEGLNYTRGYRYVFAYTAEYSANTADGTSATYTYPYGRSDYSAYMTEFGCGVEYATTLGKGVAYVLNSGMMSAPRALPEFYTYVYETNAEITGTGTSTKVEGTATVHYTYTDIDGTITTSVTTGEGTQIEYTNTSGGTESENIGNKVYSGTWYEITLPYVFSSSSVSEQVLLPEVNIQEYVITMEDTYTTILNALSNNTYTEEPFYLSQIPIEYDYGALLNSSSYVGQVNVVMYPELEENYIKFVLAKGDSAANTAPLETLIDRAYAMELTFTPTATTSENALPDAQTFYCPTTTDTTGTTTQVIFSTAQLGSDYLDVTFDVTAKIYYDDGNQGWKYLSDQTDSTNIGGYYGLQRTNIVDQDSETFEFGAYFVGSSSGTTMKYDLSGGLMQTSTIDNVAGNESKFIELLQATVGTTSYSYVRTQYKYLTSSYTFLRYLTVGYYGIHDNQSTDENSEATTYIVPKGVDVYDLAFSGGNSATLSKIVPTVGEISSNVSIDRIVVSSFQVTGESEITGYDGTNSYGTVEMRVYTSSTAAAALGNDYVSTLSVSLGSDGKPIYLPDTDGSTINYLKELGEDQLYYLVFAAEVTDGTTVESSLTVLLDQDTAEQAIYEFYTVDGILLTPSSDGIYYQNDSYLEKALTLNYTLNEYLGVEVKYDIYGSDQVTASGGSYTINKTTDTAGSDVEVEQSPLLSNDQMITDKILITTSLAYKNYMTIDLTPAAARAAIGPGATYYLKLTANTEGGEAETEKVSILPFTITSIGTIDALIYVDAASAESISYMISIMDAQNSLMGDSSIAGTNGAPYVVRFTEEDGTRIYTKYDDDIFYSGTLKQEIVLDNTQLDGASLAAYNAAQVDGYTNTTGKFDGIHADTLYTMNIYSVIDETHNGVSYSTTTDATDTGADKSEFLIAGFEKLIDLVNSFWIETGTESGTVNTALETVADYFKISSRTQTTTQADGLYLSENAGVIYVNASSKFELMLQESYGVVYTDTAGDSQQYFDEIVYDISGYTFSSVGVKEYGTTTSTSGTMFVEGTDAAGYSIYTYEVPVAVEKGSYTVTVQLWKSGTLVKTYSSSYYYN